MNEQVTLTGKSLVGDWYVRHREDYARTRERLGKCRDIVMHGDKEDAAELVRLGMINAIMSIRTDLKRHEWAWDSWQFGDSSLSHAMRKTCYGNTKAKRIHTQNLRQRAREIVQILRARNPWVAIKYINDNVTGLAFRKGAFSLAMVGIWEVMCIDSNVQRYADISDESYNNIQQYKEACERIAQSVDIDDKPFIIQWAIYDFERGEHSRHMPFFRACGIV